MVYSLIIRADVRNHQFFTVVLYTDQDTFYKISSCSGNVKEESGEAGKIQGRVREESGKSEGRVREAGKVFGDRVWFTALLLSVELF